MYKKLCTKAFLNLRDIMCTPPNRANKILYPTPLLDPIKVPTLYSNFSRSTKNAVFGQKSNLRADKFSYHPYSSNKFLYSRPSTIIFHTLTTTGTLLKHDVMQYKNLSID